MIREEELRRIGAFGKPHGVKGELQFQFTDDVWDSTEADHLIVEINGAMVPFFIEEYRFRGEWAALIKLEGIDTCEDAAELTGLSVYFPLGDVGTRCTFEGYTIVDQEGREVGLIEAVDDRTANVLFVCGELLIPAAPELVKSVDHERRRLTMELPQGILEI